MIVKIIGLIIIADGILSICFAFEPRFLWQLGRFIRIFLGILLLVAK
jgi:uncharacterized membrane protein HdeD (DUF308 family)